MCFSKRKVDFFSSNFPFSKRGLVLLPCSSQNPSIFGSLPDSIANRFFPGACYLRSTPALGNREPCRPSKSRADCLAGQEAERLLVPLSSTPAVCRDNESAVPVPRQCAAGHTLMIHGAGPWYCVCWRRGPGGGLQAWKGQPALGGGAAGRVAYPPAAGAHPLLRGLLWTCSGRCTAAARRAGSPNTSHPEG